MNKNQIQPSVGMLNRVLKIDFSSVASDTLDFFSNLPREEAIKKIQNHRFSALQTANGGREQVTL